MAEFTASNGVVISHNDRGLLRLDTPRGESNFVPLLHEVALREHFRAERDAEMNRWRSSTSSWVVVYRETRLANHFMTLDETTGLGRMWAIWGSPPGTSGGGEDWSLHAAVAAEYRAAHANPKPWQEAVVGEVWDVFIDGERHDLTVVEEDEVGLGFFGRRVKCSIRYSGITAATRIWPESDQS